MEIPGLISLLKLFISLQELILILELIPFLKSILIPLPEQIEILRSNSILIAESEVSAPELLPDT